MYTHAVRWTVVSVCIFIFGLWPGHLAHARQTEPSQEFRGTWIATVSGLDWPHGNTTAQQQAELIQLLDGLKAAGMNTVFFQVRGEADAFYESPFEPWSKWLTGKQGRAPEPFYDPLAFAIQEAHKRGLELHAWINPFRVSRNVKKLAAHKTHLINRKPKWVLRAGPVAMLDPGQPAVRDYVSGIVADIVKRYNVDGIHFDDYFYPYPPNALKHQDGRTYKNYNRGIQDVSVWRRDNINRFVAQVAQTIRMIDPTVKFGISPFGIWKQGIPKGTSGMDSYSLLYADPPTWLAEGSVDYIIPQLYWGFEGRQDYAALADWWATIRQQRHLYIGHGLYKTDQSTYDGPLLASKDITNQVSYNRKHPEIAGSAFFRAQNLTSSRKKTWAKTLTRSFYSYAAPTPTMPWKDATPPSAPEGLMLTTIQNRQVVLSWRPPHDASPRQRYAIYRIPEKENPRWEDVPKNPQYRVDLTGETFWIDRNVKEGQSYAYTVTTLSPNSVESTPSNGVNINLVRFSDHTQTRGRQSNTRLAASPGQ